MLNAPWLQRLRELPWLVILTILALGGFGLVILYSAAGGQIRPWALSHGIAQLEAGRQVAILREDGFEGVKKFLPPPSRRALLLCDPSYELKTDYGRVADMVADALQRFATGTYAVWYPIIPRPEAHDLPKKLKTLANKAGKPWLGTTLTVKSSKLLQDDAGEVIRPGLPASGMFIINPPHTLKAALQLALPQMVAALKQDANASFTMESGG